MMVLSSLITYHQQQEDNMISLKITQVQLKQRGKIMPNSGVIQCS